MESNFMLKAIGARLLLLACFPCNETIAEGSHISRIKEGHVNVLCSCYFNKQHTQFALFICNYIRYAFMEFLFLEGTG
jgi:hypothetical protein